jgi:cation diffusion facilitator family transporter
MVTRPRSADSRALLVSVAVSAAFAVVSLGWGLALGSQLILFDGLYSFAAVGLSMLAVWALRTARKGPDERYPWGREVYEPLVIVVKAVALGGLCVYALAGGVAEILRGGRDVDAGWALVYAFMATAAGAATALYLRRIARRGSGLVRAEAAEWIGDTLLSVGVLAGFAVALLLERTGHDDLARYVDPAMVVAISAAFLWVPFRLVAQGLREVLMMSPADEIRDQVLACVHDIEQERAFTESVVRTSKVGSRLDVEIVFLVDDHSTVQTVRQFDQVRRQVSDRLGALGLEPSMTVSFTADRQWA